MSPFEFLGLRPGADDRDVRKAYARLLKGNRPDDDPIAFQRLNEAYQAALEALRRRNWEAAQNAVESPAASMQESPDNPTVATSESPAAPSPVEADPDTGEAPIRFDFSGFMDELFRLIETERADSVSTWLYSRPELYSIRLKAAITMEVLRLVAERDPPVSAAALQCVSDFFGVDKLGPSGWWLAERLEDARLRSEARERFKRIPLPRAVARQDTALFDREIDLEIARPRSTWRTAMLLATPGIPTRVRDRMVELDQLSRGMAKEFMDPGLRALYFELADRTRISPKRLGLSLARSTLYGGSFGLLGFWVADDTRQAIMAAIIALCFLAWQFVVAGLLRIRAWLISSGYISILRESTAMLLLAVGVVLMSVPSTQGDLAGVGYLLMGCAALFAITAARLKAGIPLAAVILVTDLIVSAHLHAAWPFLPGSLGLATVTLLVLATDRIRSWWMKVPVSVLRTEIRPLVYLLAATTAMCVGLGKLALGIGSP